MTQWEVRSPADVLSAVQFGGTRIRRVPILLGEQRRVLLLHEDAPAGTYLLDTPAGLSGPGRGHVTLHAEWGEPLGRVHDVQVDAETGRVEAYLIRTTALGDAPVVVDATDTYWWQGNLYCRRRRTTQLRELKRQLRRVKTADVA